MLRIAQSDGKKSRIVSMSSMKPLQIGQIVQGEDVGHYVLRTASVDRFEVIDLSEPREDGCWMNNPTLRVRLLNPDEFIVLELFNLS